MAHRTPGALLGWDRTDAGVGRRVPTLRNRLPEDLRRDADGNHDGYHGEMGVLVKPNGLLGRLYMAAITPFRHLLVYPPLLRGIGQEWRDGTGDPAGLTPSRPGGRRAEAGSA